MYDSNVVMDGREELKFSVASYLRDGRSGMLLFESGLDY